MKVTLINGEVRLDLPQYIIDDSITIQDMINDSSSSQSITIETFLPIDSLRSIGERCPLQDSLPILDFLNCSNLLRMVGSKILDSGQILSDYTARLFFTIPSLAYMGLLKGRISIDCIPTYDLSYEELLQWHKNDVDIVIRLLNLRVPPSILLPDITTATMQVVDSIILHHCNDTNIDGLTTLLVGLLNRLEDINSYVLEPLVRQFHHSIILDRIFRLREVNTIKRLATDGLITECTDYSWLALELQCDELIDLIVEYQLNGYNYGITFIEGVLQYNYLYPLKYVEPDTLGHFFPKYMAITIDDNELDQVIELVSDNQPIVGHIIDLLVINGRIDLALPRLHLINLDEHRELWKDKILLSYLDDEVQYKQLIGIYLNLDVATLSRLVRSDYSKLAKTIVDSLTSEQLSMLLILTINDEYDAIINEGIIVRISELVSLESYEEFLTSKIVEYREEYQQLIDENMELELYHRSIILSLIDAQREYANDNDLEVEPIYYSSIPNIISLDDDRSDGVVDILNGYHRIIRTLLR